MACGRVEGSFAFEGYSNLMGNGRGAKSSR